MTERLIPEDKVVWGRDGQYVPGAIILGIIVAILFFGLVGYGLNDAFTIEHPPVTLLIPTTGG